MKSIIFCSMMLFFISYISYESFFYFDRKSEVKEVIKHRASARLTEEEVKQLREGDIILRKGFGYFSEFVSQRLNSGKIDVTHAGIITKKKDALFVIHSLSSSVTKVDGVQIQSLETFLEYSFPNKIIISRLKNSDEKIGRTIAAQAEVYLANKVPFDSQGDYDDSTKLYCTELIWTILEKDLKILKIPTEAKERKIFFLSMMPMYDSVYFDLVINHYK